MANGLYGLFNLFPSIIKDTNDFLLTLKELGGASQNVVICTIDVVGLYPHISHCEGLEALRNAINDGEVEIPTEHLLNLAKLIIENNYFEFDERVYWQNWELLQKQSLPQPSQIFSWGGLKIRSWRLIVIDRGFGSDSWMIYL